jgi:hypothetical protein
VGVLLAVQRIAQTLTNRAQVLIAELAPIAGKARPFEAVHCAVLRAFAKVLLLSSVLEDP